MLLATHIPVPASPVCTITGPDSPVSSGGNCSWRFRRPPLAPGAPTTRSVTTFTGVLTPGFIKRADVAWFASHRHDSAGLNEAYAYSYLYAFAIDVPKDATTITLPDNERIRVMAITVADEPSNVQPARPLYDTLVHSDH